MIESAQKPIKDVANPRFERYVFICTNERPKDHPRGSCGAGGGLALVVEFKRQMQEKGLQTKIRINKSGCMELCEIGPTVMIHPDNVWYSKVTLTDVAEIVESHLLGDQVVERLLSDYSVYKK